MFKLIEKLRKKPEGKRQKIVLAVAFSITLIIAAFWLVALVIKIQSGGFTLTSDEGATGSFNRSAEELGSSWSEFLNSLNSITDSIPTATSTVPAEEVATTTPDETGDNVE